MQKVLPNVLPQISGILENVNRQMLLIFKTNDLIRGLEHTLCTSARMGAFRVMSKCCVRSVYREKIDNASTKVDKVKMIIVQYWLLFKINMYYTMLSLGQICNTVVNLGQRSLQIIKR